MLTRNYYNCLCYSVLRQSAGTVNNEDDPFAAGNLYLKSNIGTMCTPSVSRLYVELANYTYPNTQYVDGGYGLWPCGSSDSTLECAEPNFNSYSVSTPLLPSTQIQASNHIVSPAVFDSATNKWTRKVKRSFKNISGSTLYIYEQTWSQCKTSSSNAASAVFFDITKLETPLVVNADEFFTLELNFECAYPEPAA